MPKARRISPAEPVTEVRRVPIREIGEPLVDYLLTAPRAVQARARFQYKRETLVRTSVAEMIRVASESLPAGYTLGVIEGWRPPHIQRRMYLSTWNRFREQHPEWSDAQLRRFANRYTAPLHGSVPPPHSTGGAVDFVLIEPSGEEADMMSPFTRLNPKAFSFHAEGLSDSARKNRDMLGAALSLGGLTNYPSEYWHWSFGDQGWAYRGGHPHALYDRTEPPGYVAPEEDDNDEPFVFLLQ